MTENLQNLQNKKSVKAEKTGSITNLIFDIYGVILRDDLVETEIAKTVDFIRENYKNPESKFAFYYYMRNKVAKKRNL